MRRTKIVATAGPAWDRPGMLDALLAAGVDVARLNASHATRGELERRVGEIRAASDRLGLHVAIMLDLSGPKVRLGEIAPDTLIAEGSRFSLVAEEVVGDDVRASTNYPGLSDDLKVGQRVLIDDGAVELRVTRCAKGRVDAEVVVGGPLSSHKGLNAPESSLSVDAATAKDLDDAAWAAGAGIDWLAQSFVRRPEDLESIRRASGGGVPIVAKFETHEAVEVLDDIVAAADAIMVARGDLGVETSPEAVPVIQHRLVRSCRAAGMPVIIATQMLESMRTGTRPTRAEASDVATAVFQLADAVMLSAESAVGSRPVAAVETMARIAESVEDHLSSSGLLRGEAAGGADTTSAVSAAACDLAADLASAAIVTATESGTTARAVAAHRPDRPVLAITPYASVARRLALVWGVRSVLIEPLESIEATAEAAVGAALRGGLAAPGDTVVLTAGVALNRPGTTDMVRVLHA